MRTDTEGASLETATLQRAHRLILAMRLFEERIQSYARRGAIRGSTHLAIGQEAVAAGLRVATDDGDVVAPTYRGHGWSLAWGLDLREAFAEMFGRDTGCNRGRGGSKHFGSRQHGILPANAIVAAALPIATGVAWQAKRTGSDRLSVVPFGDGATNQAAFHEAMHLARIWNLPVLFVCENNLYSEMTPIAEMSPFVDMAQRASGYDIPAVIVDGMDVSAVAEGAAEAVARARAGDGPTFIEAKTYRFCGHMPGDSEPYRTPEEVSEWMQRDPLTLIRTSLAAQGIAADEIEAVESEVAAAVDDAEQLALGDPEPTADEIRLGVSEWMETTR
jgi:acetoin:2,6-dichlorophenolindophenol oxidoreductase subunit alpha